MGGTRIPAKLTQTSPEDAIFALDAMWEQIAHFSNEFPERADIASLAILIAQWSFETNWGQDMYNYNWLSIPWEDGDLHDYTLHHVKRNINGLVFDATEQIRAYHSVPDGALDFLLWISKHYSSAWQHVLSGDVTAYLDCLEECGFFTTKSFNANNYKYAVSLIADKIRYEHPTRPDIKLPPDSAEAQAEFNKKERAHVLNLVAMALWGLAGEIRNLEVKP